jgi:hypothetical protein
MIRNINANYHYHGKLRRKVSNLQIKINGGSLGLNLGNGYSNRAFVDQVSSIIATNLVNINVAIATNLVNINVANDTNIAGALIANQNNQGIDLGNLNLKTKSLTYSDLNNFSVSESNQLGLNLQAGYNPNNPTQNGNLAINLNMQGRESSSTTKATIGKGNISIDEILNDETKIANLNRDINNIEQNKRDVITSDFDAELKIDLRLIASVGNLAVGNTDKATANWDSYATQTVDGAKITYKFTPMGASELIENYTGQEMSWASGDVARFKEKGREFETAVVGANTIGKANSIDLVARPDLAYLVGQPLKPYPGYEGASWNQEGGAISLLNVIPGFNSMSVFHDKFTEDTFLGEEVLLELSIIPAIPINYYGLIGKELRNLYE